MAGQRVPQEAEISAREAEVLAALGEHLTNAEIGAQLFISVRTVESHVSSLLRKLQVDDRRALAARAGRPTREVPALPKPLTSFVGRVAERTTLAAALAEHRLVTAVGPGGVGKTRLALSIAAEEADRFADGVWYADLVPVTDALMIAPAIADTLGLGERQGSSAEDSVVSWLAEREALLVLDNCEHLLDGAVLLLERLLAAAPRLRVLATSRARLLVPFERVFPVPGLSVQTRDGGAGDAVELFLARAAAGGSPVRPEERERVAAVCRALEGMALAIELAAARYPSLGLDGLETGLADRLQLLTGGRRLDDRHRSLRSTLDWSYALLAEPERAVLRRISVFAEPFTAVAATVVLAGFPPSTHVPTVLAGLADQSLLIAIPGPGGTRYRALETVRQYSADRLAEAGETQEAHTRHLTWCRAEGKALERASRAAGDQWRTTFDEIADELRSALTWAAVADPPAAHRLASDLAALCFLRGLPGESQRRYEQAGDLAADDLSAADAFRHAAGAAEARHFGNEALRLRQRSADAALRGGDRSGAARDLARNAELIHRAIGLMATRPAPGAEQALVVRSRELAADDPTVEGWGLLAEASHDPGPATFRLIERALELAGRLGDPLFESAVLDQLTSIQLAAGEIRAAAASARRRTERLAAMPMTAIAGLEFFDSYVMAAESAVAAGDLRGARVMAERLHDLPFYREEGHLATSRLLVVTVLAGDWSEAVGLGERFREGWERAGRPRAGNLSRGAYAVATLHGLQGDDEGRSTWVDIVRGLESPGQPLSGIHYREFFDAMLLLHRGRAPEALELMQAPPEELAEWYNGMWRPWYTALWAESAVLAGADDVSDRLRRARAATTDNPIAAAVVDRAAALATPGGDRDGLSAAAAALLEAGCRYQWARTLVLIGDEQRAHGQSVLAEMGATPMAVPPG